MREIRPSGSGEGAVLSRPYLISSGEATSSSVALTALGPIRSNFPGAFAPGFK